jgi:hypothetical protein
MADIEAIRRGLAGNLRAVPDCQVSAYLLDNPTAAALQVAGFDEIDYVQSFGDDTSFSFVIEGSAGLASDIGSQQRFDRWLGATGDESVKSALEANRTLTSRLLDNGTVQTGQVALADDLQVRLFRGYRKARLANGSEVLLGDWLVELVTPD